MSHREVHNIYLRPQLGRRNDQDRALFVWREGMSIGAFIDENHIELREAV